MGDLHMRIERLEKRDIEKELRPALVERRQPEESRETRLIEPASEDSGARIVAAGGTGDVRAFSGHMGAAGPMETRRRPEAMTATAKL
jgi:hypothetical protein